MRASKEALCVDRLASERDCNRGREAAVEFRKGGLRCGPAPLHVLRFRFGDGGAVGVDDGQRHGDAEHHAVIVELGAVARADDDVGELLLDFQSKRFLGDAVLGEVHGKGGVRIRSAATVRLSGAAMAVVGKAGRSRPAADGGMPRMPSRSVVASIKSSCDSVRRASCDAISNAEESSLDAIEFIPFQQGATRFLSRSCNCSIVDLDERAVRSVAAVHRAQALRTFARVRHSASMTSRICRVVGGVCAGAFDVESAGTREW